MAEPRSKVWYYLTEDDMDAIDHAVGGGTGALVGVERFLPVTDVIRREVAKELERFALVHRDIARELVPSPAAPIHADFFNELKQRAEEIRNG